MLLDGLQLLTGFFFPTKFAQNCRQLKMSFARIRLQLESLLQLFPGLCRFPEFGKHKAQAVAGVVKDGLAAPGQRRLARPPQLDRLHDGALR